jgi:hypothetical protein
MPWQVVASRDEGDLAAALERCVAGRREVAAAQLRWFEAHATAAASAEAMLQVYACCAGRGAGRVHEQEGLS